MKLLGAIVLLALGFYGIYRGLRAIYDLGFREGYTRGEIAGSRNAQRAKPRPRPRRNREVQLIDTGKVVALRRRRQLQPSNHEDP